MNRSRWISFARFLAAVAFWAVVAICGGGLAFAAFLVAFCGSVLWLAFRFR